MGKTLKKMYNPKSVFPTKRIKAFAIKRILKVETSNGILVCAVMKDDTDVCTPTLKVKTIQARIYLSRIVK